MASNPRFGDLLSEGIRSVASRQYKKIAFVEREIAEALGFASHHTIERWRRGFIPKEPEQVAFLVRYCITYGRVDRSWAESLLRQARYFNSEALLREIFPTASLITERVHTEVPSLQQSIVFSIEQADITSFEADVLALKYAQKFFGTDEIVAHLLNRVGIATETLRPQIGDFRYVQTRHCIQAHYALFVGVPDILDFTYQDIQEFSAQVLNVLATKAPTTKHLVMTIHGAGFGLDEIEAFLAQFRGYLQALQRGQFPSSLQKITIIDRDLERVRRLRHAFEETFSFDSFISKARDKWAYHLDKQQLLAISKNNQEFERAIPTTAAIGLEAKRHVFVAMPFKKEMDDVFYYGIQQPVRAAGFICERIDQEAFIGDILNQVKKKIETAAVVVAELSDANPNVYLEVGYAWGKGRPTILLMRNDQELRFDVRGQRCLKYERIRDLEESLQRELHELNSNGFI